MMDQRHPPLPPHAPFATPGRRTPPRMPVALLRVPLVTLIATIAMLTPTIRAAEDPITDPIPEKIAKSDIRVELQQVAEGLGSPVWLTHANDKSGRLFVCDQAGKVWLIKDGKLLSTPFLDVTDQLVELKKGFDERGLLGLAFHPGFADPASPGYRKFYTYQSEPVSTTDKPMFTVDLKVGDVTLPPDHQSVIAEWQVKSVDDDVADKSSKRVVMRFDEPQFNHDGGCLVFDNEGMLLFGTGDGGAGNDLGPGHTKGGNGQDTEVLLGKILRLDPTGAKGKRKFDGAYSIPFDNPKYGAGCCLEEIVAYGIRNPWRMSYDHKTGTLIVGDIGQEQIEEINLVNVKEGANYGWPVKEGPFYFHQEAPKGQNITREPAAGDNVPPDMIDPAAMYDHDEGISVIGGFVYHGSAIAALTGRYVFGEWRLMEAQTQPDGKIKRVPIGGRMFVTDIYAKSPVITELRIGADDRKVGDSITAFGEGGDGELYLMTNTGASPLGDGGKVYKIVPVK